LSLNKQGWLGGAEKWEHACVIGKTLHNLRRNA